MDFKCFGDSDGVSCLSQLWVRLSENFVCDDRRAVILFHLEIANLLIEGVFIQHLAFFPLAACSVQ